MQIKNLHCEFYNKGSPQFWWLLSDTDKYLYNKLLYNISTKSAKTHRNKRIEKFTEIFNEIKEFVCHDEKCNIRGLVCGVFWIKEGIAINTHQLRFLIPKCKSSINGSLQKMGYSSNLGRTDATFTIINLFPILRDNNSEQRKWSVRRKEMCTSPVDSPMPFNDFEKSSVESKNGYFSISLDGLIRHKTVNNNDKEMTSDISNDLLPMTSEEFPDFNMSSGQSYQDMVFLNVKGQANEEKQDSFIDNQFPDDEINNCIDIFYDPLMI